MNQTEAKDYIVSALTETHRENMDILLNWMDTNGFWTAPAAGAYHMACEGGLAIHTANVVNIAFQLWALFGADIPEDSVAISAALHDLGKCGQYGKSMYVENLLKSGKRSDSKPYETNRDLLSVPHEIRSIQIAGGIIDLTEEESFAILYHNGLYGPLKYEIQGKETPLYMIIHWADMWASRVVERTKENE